jgi:two-component system cell cycle response regulator DivK
MSVDQRLVLVVEDDVPNRELLVWRLERHGYRTVSAPGGQHGIDAALEHSPDLILLDMGLPQLDGWAVVKLLKADPRTAGIPVVALTAHAMPGDRERALAAGCDDYQTKPVEFAELFSKIGRLLAA